MLAWCSLLTGFALAQEAPTPPAAEQAANDEAPEAPVTDQPVDDDTSATSAEEQPTEPTSPPPTEQAPVEVEPKDKGPAWQRDGWGFGAIPAANYNADEGVGLGAVGSLYKYDGVTSPYRVGVTLLLFASTRGVHSHRLEIDALKLWKGRLRLTTRLNMDINKVNVFCGFGPDVTCDPAVAAAAADDLGLTGDARETFVRRYYLSSYIRPNLFMNGRWKLDKGKSKLKVELMTTLRLALHRPGDFKNIDSDPGNLISTRLDEEQGFLSVVQVGMMLDSRDFESAPSRGIWTEASIRGASKVIGSDFDYFGFNTTTRGYIPILPEGRLVSATRVAVDGIVGDVPIREMAEMGGAQIYNFGGGLNAGRGIRQRRYLGRFKGLLQEELRWKVVHLEPFKIPIDIGLLGFGDLTFVATDWDSLDELGRPIPSFGGGLRLAVDDNFIIRFDLGFSAVEAFDPKPYLDLNNLF